MTAIQITLTTQKLLVRARMNGEHVCGVCVQSEAKRAELGKRKREKERWSSRE